MEKIPTPVASSAASSNLGSEDSFGELDDDFLQKINEEASKQALKKFRQMRMSVTDFTSINWCEVQYRYKKILGKPPPTQTMIAGTKRHLELEEEVHDLVKIETETHLDIWGSIFLDAILRVQCLIKKGIAREVPVFGFLKEKTTGKKVLVRGIIDLIENKHFPSKKDDLLFLSDNKTRLSFSLPKKIQKGNHELQLMIYKKLLDNMISCGKKALTVDSFYSSTIEDLSGLFSDFDSLPVDILYFLSLNPQEKFSDIFIKELKKYKVHTMLSKGKDLLESPSILDLVKIMLLQYALLPETSGSLTILYEHQKTNKFIGSSSFDFDPVLTNENINTALECHFELRGASGVTDIEEACFKCSSCDFASVCSWRNDMAQKYVHSNVR